MQSKCAHIQNFFEFWRKVFCPKCLKPNWIYDSHSLRAYPHIPNACKCWDCQNVFWLGEEEEFITRFDHLISQHSLEYVMKNCVGPDDGQEEPD